LQILPAIKSGNAREAQNRSAVTGLYPVLRVYVVSIAVRANNFSSRAEKPPLAR
jgi:hypothetical protein